ncbi:MAG: 6,7-dimethyl-8-ribityllumazine synthase [Gammaproteobacteria bacterium]|nr:6,7-dimethyl-8-ribityllumazine synthase [Gammaproteobacteria bacterium]
MQILNVKNIPGRFNIAIVVSRFNQEITQKQYEGAIKRLQELDFDTQQITVVWVPGAIEIPLAAQRLAKTEKFEAIICLGAVIMGETQHFDFVCQQVSYGCQKVALKYDIPVIFGILTTHTEEQAYDRVGGKQGHIGRSVVDTAFEFISVLHQI